MLDVGEVLYLLLPAEEPYGGGCQPAPDAIFPTGTNPKFDALDVGKMKLCVKSPALLRLDLIYASEREGGREGKEEERQRCARASRSARDRN